MGRLGQFLLKILKADTPESSKRLLAVGAFILVVYIVVRFTTSENLTWVLDALLLFILALLGIASWQAVKVNSNEKQKDGET